MQTSGVFEEEVCPSISSSRGRYFVLLGMLSAGLRRGAPLRAAPACCAAVRWMSSSSAAKSVAVVPGDGIGPEVMDEAIKVLDAGAPRQPRASAPPPR